MNEIPVAIIIPVRNSGEFLHLTIESIMGTMCHPYKILLIDSESTDGTTEYCKSLSHLDYIEYYSFPKGSVTKAINYGIQKAGDLDVLLTQDDVIFHKFLQRNLLTELNELSKRDNCGIATVYNGGGVSGDNYCKGFLWVGTWCMYIPRTTIDKVGLFDEKFGPGDGDDIDYTYNVIEHGLGIGMTDLFVEHHRKFDINAHEHESQDIKKRNSKYFKRKWKL